METSVWILPVGALAGRFDPRIAVVCLVGWITGAVLAYLWPMRIGTVARHADRSRALHATCDTALHLRTTGHPAAGAVALDAVDALAEAGPVPVITVARPFRILGSLALAGLVLLWPAAALSPPAEIAQATPADTPSDLAVLESTARARGDDALADAALRIRAALEARVEILPLAPPAATPEPLVPEAPSPESPLEPEPAATVLFAPTEAPAEPRSRWEDDPVAMQLAKDLHAALAQYMKLDDMKNKAVSKARVAGGNNPFDNPIERNANPPGTAMSPGQRAATGTALQESGLPDGAAGAKDVANEAQRYVNDVAKRTAHDGHENAAVMQKAWDDFLEAYSDTLRDRLMEVLEEFEKAENAERSKDRAGGRPKEDGGLEMPGGEGRPGTEPSEETSAPPSTSELASGPSMEAKVEGPADSAKTSGDGGLGETSPGGAGAGLGRDGTQASATPGSSSGNGESDEVQGRFHPGSLSLAEEQALYDALEAKGSVEGTFEAFGPEVEPYMAEARNTLAKEPVDPRMASWIESYLEGVSDQRL